MSKSHLGFVALVGLVVIIAVTVAGVFAPVKQISATNAATGWHEPVVIAKIEQPSKQIEPPQSPRLDAYGDPLPPGAVSRIGSSRFRRAANAYRMVYTPAARDFMRTFRNDADDTAMAREAAAGLKRPEKR